MVWTFQAAQNLSSWAVDLLDEKISQEFKVNGHRVKHYIHSVADCSNEDLLLKEPSY